MPAAALAKRSIAAARAYGPVADDRHRLHAGGGGDIADADHLGAGDRPEPVGASWLSVSLVAIGNPVATREEDRRGGGGGHQDRGGDRSLPIVGGGDRDGLGWVPGALDGYTASATPAASAIGSAPATRVVFLVATAGKPSFCPA